ncbi:zinc carboxypeptidase-like [Trichoplusia ni]|uniref:Zinc carboxypeptidase-like n=1 Tax=Trichoplusia ni TaxID=7111 RepID=A0A7E5WNF8_TRINI|nr:zinc carboxypeptidase-like [Trichoplusia ni]
MLGLKKRDMYILYVFLSIFIGVSYSMDSKCGCKSLRPCYAKMLRILLDRDEAACIEDAAIGASTVTIFLKAIKEYCSEVVNVISDDMTYEGRHLYEVIINSNKGAPRADDDPMKPVFIIEAGQQGGTEPVGLALYVVEQLVACEEYESMLQKVTWVILPCTNPDGQEYSRYSQIPWKKNLRPSEDQLSYGVDITRNFDNQWGSCAKVESSFSPIYPGPSPASENETIFIKSVIAKYKKEAKVYLSIRRDGHALHYPYGYTKNPPVNIHLIYKIAAEVTTRVNQRTGGVHLFVNESVFDSESKAHCGHSVDYAYDSGISLSFEMRVFLGSDNRIMAKFQPLPRGYETSLRNGYFSGIREMYTCLTTMRKHGRMV